MEFNSISIGHSCNCLSNAIENFTDTFVRKVDATTEFKIRDFRAKYEKDNFVEIESSTCEEVCGNRCLSIDIWNDESKEYIIKKYSVTLGISPKLKPNFIGLFKLNEGSGKVKYTPNQKHGIEIYHYDLYKSDGFTIDMLELIEIRTIPNSNV